MGGGHQRPFPWPALERSLRSIRPRASRSLGGRARDGLGFLRQIEKSVPEELDVHLIVDNTCTLKHALVRRSSAQR